MADEEHEYLRSSADESVVDYLIERLDDPLPESRQEAAIALADLQGKARARCRSYSADFARRPSRHMTARVQLGPWAVSSTTRIASFRCSLPLCESRSSRKRPAKCGSWQRNDAGELRHRAAEAVERLTEDLGVLLPLARCCLEDRFWKCRLFGLGLVRRLGEQGRELLSLVKPLVNDEEAEIRQSAERIVAEGS